VKPAVLLSNFSKKTVFTFEMKQNLNKISVAGSVDFLLFDSFMLMQHASLAVISLPVFPPLKTAKVIVD